MCCKYNRFSTDILWVMCIIINVYGHVYGTVYWGKWTVYRGEYSASGHRHVKPDVAPGLRCVISLMKPNLLSKDGEKVIYKILPRIYVIPAVIVWDDVTELCSHYAKSLGISITWIVLNY